MKTVDFTDDLLTGNDTIDEHHRALFEWGNRALAHGDEVPDGRTVAEVLAFLAGYVHYHFAAEEQAMERLSYPRLAQHRKLHDTFRREVAALREATAGDAFSRKQAARLHYLLSDWLTYHIRHVDQAFAEYAQDASLDLMPLPEDPDVVLDIEDDEELMARLEDPDLESMTVVDQEGVIPASELAKRRYGG